MRNAIFTSFRRPCWCAPATVASRFWQVGSLPLYRRYLHLSQLHIKRSNDLIEYDHDRIHLVHMHRLHIYILLGPQQYTKLWRIHLVGTKQSWIHAVHGYFSRHCRSSKSARAWIHATARGIYDVISQRKRPIVFRSKNSLHDRKKRDLAQNDIMTGLPRRRMHAMKSILAESLVFLSRVTIWPTFWKKLGTWHWTVPLWGTSSVMGIVKTWPIGVGLWVRRVPAWRGSFWTHLSLCCFCRNENARWDFMILCAIV